MSNTKSQKYAARDTTLNSRSHSGKNSAMTSLWLSHAETEIDASVWYAYNLNNLRG